MHKAEGNFYIFRHSVYIDFDRQHLKISQLGIKENV